MFLDDVLPNILSHLDDDDDVASSALVNPSFHRAASALLYNTVANPRLCPRYAHHVRTILLTSDSPPVPAIPAYTNLQTISLTPASPRPFLPALLRALHRTLSLRNLSINAAAVHDSAHILLGIHGLRTLTITDPARALLQVLLIWLESLADSLLELHLTGNCGSITPGVFRSFIPHLHSIRALSLGLSYSLTNADIFSVLPSLPHLQSLQLQYYLQLAPLPPLHLPHLRAFTALHPPIHSRATASRLSAWIKCIIAPAHSLHSLRTICNPPAPSESIAFDGLLRHLAARHRALHELRLGSAFVGAEALGELCARCARLEVLAVGVGRNVLARFADLAAQMQGLHTVALDVRNIKRAHRDALAGVGETVLQGVGARAGLSGLRRMSVCGVRWEGWWESVSESDAGVERVRFEVRRVGDAEGW